MIVLIALASFLFIFIFFIALIHISVFLGKAKDWIKRMIFVFIPFVSHSQSNSDSLYFSLMEYQDTSSGILISDICFDCERLYDKYSEISVYYKGITAASMDSIGNLIVMDSLSAIKVFFEMALYHFRESEKLMRQFESAKDILSLISVDGHISNWRKFNKAVKNYQKLNP